MASVFTKAPALILGSPGQNIDLSARSNLHIFLATQGKRMKYYVLKMSRSLTYSLIQVDGSKESFKPFLPDHQREYPYFQFSLYKKGTIKDADQSIHVLVDSIIEKNKQYYKKMVSYVGYNQTKAETILDGIMECIPFYQSIQEIKHRKNLQNRRCGGVPMRALFDEPFQRIPLSTETEASSLYRLRPFPLKETRELSDAMIDLMKRVKALKTNEWDACAKELSELINRDDFKEGQSLLQEKESPLAVVKLKGFDHAPQSSSMDSKTQILCRVPSLVERKKEPLSQTACSKEKWIFDREIESIIKRINHAIDKTDYIGIEHACEKIKNFLIEVLSEEEIFSAIEGLSRETFRLSKELRSIRKELEPLKRGCIYLNQQSDTDKEVEKRDQDLTKEYGMKTKRFYFYPNLVQALSRSWLYRMRLAKALFFRYNPSLREVYRYHLNKPTLFEMRDENQNGVLHYLAATKDPASVSFFFHTFLEHKDGLKQGMMHPNKEGKTPFELLIENVHLERYKRGTQKNFNKFYEIFQNDLVENLINRRILTHQTLFDQVWELFERHIDWDAIPHDTIYEVFRKGWEQNGEREFEENHWLKVRRWINRNLLIKINAVDPKTGETFLEKAIKKDHVHLVERFMSNKYLDLSTICFPALYDIFAFLTKEAVWRYHIEASVWNTLFKRKDEVDSTNGDTFLHRAVRSGNGRLVEYLKNVGVDDGIKNGFQKTPEDLAKNEIHLLYPLFNQAARIEARGSRFQRWVQSYFFMGVNVVLDPENGDTLLHQAARARNVDLLVYLKNHGAKDRIKKL